MLYNLIFRCEIRAEKLHRTRLVVVSGWGREEEDGEGIADILESRGGMLLYFRDFEVSSKCSSSSLYSQFHHANEI